MNLNSITNLPIATRSCE